MGLENSPKCHITQRYIKIIAICDLLYFIDNLKKTLCHNHSQLYFKYFHVSRYQPDRFILLHTCTYNLISDLPTAPPASTRQPGVVAPQTKTEKALNIRYTYTCGRFSVPGYSTPTSTCEITYFLYGITHTIKATPIK